MTVDASLNSFSIFQFKNNEEFIQKYRFHASLVPVATYVCRAYIVRIRECWLVFDKGGFSTSCFALYMGE